VKGRMQVQKYNKKTGAKGFIGSRLSDTAPAAD
jgi:hypothetical protein